jgi:hypothetical protein
VLSPSVLLCTQSTSASSSGRSHEPIANIFILPTSRFPSPNMNIAGGRTGCFVERTRTWSGPAAIRQLGMRKFSFMPHESRKTSILTAECPTAGAGNETLLGAADRASACARWPLPIFVLARDVAANSGRTGIARRWRRIVISSPYQSRKNAQEARPEHTNRHRWLLTDGS